MTANTTRRDNPALILKLQLGVFLFALFVFIAAPVIQVTDSRYTILLSECILHHHTVALDTYNVPTPRVPERPASAEEASVYQLMRARDHTTYYYPQGSSILSIPFVAVLNAFGLSAATPTGALDFQGEVIIERVIASLLMAALTCVMFHTAAIMLSIRWSLIVALGAALGTQIFSTASRGLWSHTWQILVLGVLVDALLASEHRSKRLRPAWIATLVAWLYFIRPTGSIAIVTVSIYMLVHRRDFFVYGATLAAWLAAFVGYSWIVFGAMLPPYYFANRFNFDDVIPAVLGNLVSPSRGLFVFVPTVAFVIYLVARYRSRLEHRPLVILAFVNIIALGCILTIHQHWSGGLCYGARLFTDVTPWFVLLAIVGLDAMRRTVEVPGRRIELAAGFLLLALSIAINAHGACSMDTLEWNHVVGEDNPNWISLWRYPQFMAGLIDPPEDSLDQIKSRTRP